MPLRAFDRDMEVERPICWHNLPLGMA